MVRAMIDRQLPKLDVSIPSKKEFMALLTEVLAAGKITPIVDRVFPLAEDPQAMRYL